MISKKYIGKEVLIKNCVEYFVKILHVDEEAQRIKYVHINPVTKKEEDWHMLVPFESFDFIEAS